MTLPSAVEDTYIERGCIEPWLWCAMVDAGSLTVAVVLPSILRGSQVGRSLGSILGLLLLLSQQLNRGHPCRTSSVERLPAEFKHINKRRKRNQPGFPE